MIVVERLSFSYPNGPKALHEVSFRIGPGESVGLVGPNGAGKTSLFLCLCGVLKVRPGMATLDGLDPGDSRQRKQLPGKVGVVFQNSDDQIFHATVADDVAFGPLNMGLSATEIRSRVADAIEQVGLGGLEQRVPYHLSGGEKRRTALAGILALRPGIFLFDEPSMYLDPRGRQELIATLHDLTGTKIIASHDLELILQTCSRVLVLEHGKLVADGPARQILGDNAIMEAHGLEVPHSLRPGESIEADDALGEELAELRSALFDATVREQRERTLLAKRLHNKIAQVLVACKMQHGQLRRLNASAEAAELLAEIDRVVDDGLLEVRRLIAELRGAAQTAAETVPGLPQAVTASEPVKDGRTIKVLVADDSEWLREALRRVLQQTTGFSIVAEVESGEDAISEALAHAPDVILMDVNMPDMDGIEATQRITAERPGIVIIGFTVHEDHQVIERMKRAGAAACLCKDADGDVLCRTIRQLVGEARNRT